MADQGVKAFDSHGHSTGRDSGDFGYFASALFKLIAVGQIGLVCLLVGGGQLWLVGQTLLQLGHVAARL
jgi:hypothetical protein